MKRIIILALLLTAVLTAASAQNYVYTEASDLTLVGKLMPGKTANPYHRVDTTLYKGFTKRENELVRMVSSRSRSFSIFENSGNRMTEKR